MTWEEEIKPAHDLDGDGWANYLEFQLGTDPWVRNSMLALVPPMEPDAIDLWHPHLYGADWVLEYAFHPNGPWSDASDQLDVPMADPENPGFEFSPVSNIIESTFPVFWRMRFTGEIPDLSDALAEPAE